MTGTTLTKLTPAPQFFMTSSNTQTSNNGTNTTLRYQVLAQRQLSFTSTLQTSAGTIHASWQQTLQYSNTGFFTNNGNNQTNTQLTSGLDISSSGYSRKFSYPLYVASSIEGGNGAVDGSTGLTGAIDRGKNVLVLGASAFPDGLENFEGKGAFDGWSLVTRQNGSSGYSRDLVMKTGTSYGATEQEYVFAGIKVGDGGANGHGIGSGGITDREGDAGGMAQIPFASETEPLFQRRVLAINGSVASDSLQDVGEGVFGNVMAQEEHSYNGFATMDDGEFAGGKFIHSV